MLDKMKGLSTHVVTKASDAVGGLTTTVKGGMDSFATTAGSMTGALNEKAVRASTAQVCSILELAIEELKSRPLSHQRVSLTATVNIGIAALEMQVHLNGTDRQEETQSPDLVSTGPDQALSND